MSAPTIRPYETANVDASIIKAFILRIQTEEYGINDPDHLQDIEDVNAAYTRDGGGLWVATNEDGVPIGTIALHAIGAAGTIKRLYVDAAYRGERGASHALLHALLDHAHRNAIREVYLGARIVGPSAAIRFFRKHGFEDAERANVPAGAPISKHDTHFFKLNVIDCHS